MSRKSKKSIVLFVKADGQPVDISEATDIRIFNGQARIGTPGKAMVYKVSSDVAVENLPELLKMHGFKLRGLTNEGRTALSHNYKFSK